MKKRPFPHTAGKKDKEKGAEIKSFEKAVVLPKKE